MLSAVLRSKTAIEVSIKIIDSFVNMRKFLQNNASIFQRIDKIETKQLEFKLETDDKFNKIFDAIENKEIKPKQHIFYDGQIFDAYLFVSDIIKSAKKSIILIDNYIDESVLILFSKRDNRVTTTFYTKNVTRRLELDLQKYNKQYPKIEIKKFDLSHDRFLIIDGKEVYHIGASLKDLGKKPVVSLSNHGLQFQRWIYTLGDYREIKVNMRKICIFTGTRAGYGLLKPLIDELKPDLLVGLGDRFSCLLL